jgi:Tol biopolymer transport system component
MQNGRLLLSTSISLALFLGLTSCQTTTNGTPKGGAGGGGGTLYYSLPTKLEIHKLDLGTGADAKLGKGVAPSVAPDGRIVYTSPNDLVESAEDLVQQRAIVKATLDGDPQTGDGFKDPRVSPDGTKVAYETLEGALYVVNRDDGAVVSSFDNGGGQTHGWFRPTWTPDGRVIVSGDFGNPGFFRSDAGLTTLERFDPDFPASMFADPVYLAVSPDGTKVTFVKDHQVNVMNVDGSGLAVLDTDETATDTYPTWSPDGSQIAYFSTAGHLLIRPARGGDATDVLEEFPDLADKILIFETTAPFDWR